MATDSKGFQGVETLRHQLRNQRRVIVVMRQVELAKAETSWEATQPAYDGGSRSGYSKGPGELG